MPVHPATIPTVRHKIAVHAEVPPEIVEAMRLLASFLAGRPSRSLELVLDTDLPDPRAIRRIIKAGKLPATPIGRRYWIQVRDLLAYLEANQAAPRGRQCANDGDDVTREVAAAAGMHVKRARSR